MTKRILGTAALSLLLLLGTPAVASAHVLKVDGHIGAVLHINPDDNPTTGNSTDYVLAFDDNTNQFSLSKCNCSVSIIEGGKTISTKPLVVSSNEVSEDHYTFLKPDVYDIRFTGTPKTSTTFQSFILDYDVRVTGGASSSQQDFPLTLWIGLGMGIGLILLAAYAMNYSTSEITEEEKQ